MARPKHFAAWMVIGAMLALVLPIAGTAIAGIAFPHFRFSHLPLHSLIEAAGGLIALAIAGILLAELGHKTNTNHYPPMAAALLSMGLLDLFHAASAPGVHFVWLHSTATFAGGIFFGLVWLAPFVPPSWRGFRIPIVVGSGGLLLGVVSIVASDALPRMSSQQGNFTAAALLLNIVGGVGFLASAVFFMRRFLATGDVADWTFGVHTALFGAAGVLFAYSILWDAGWWWWHVLRLAAYIAALTYGLRAFRDAERELRDLNRQLAQTNSVLDQKIEQKTAKLRASEERFELAVRGSSDGLWDWNVSTNEVYYSPRFKELIGYADDEFPNVMSSFERILHPKDHAWVFGELQQHLNHRKPYDVEYQLRTKSNGYRWFRARGQAIWDAADAPQRMAGSITDITDHKQSEIELASANSQLEGVLNASTQVAIVSTDLHGLITVFNSGAENLLGYSADEMVGKQTPVVLHLPEELEARGLELSKELGYAAEGFDVFVIDVEKSRFSQREWTFVRKDGKHVAVNLIVTAIRNAADEITGLLGVAEDITIRKQAEDELKRAKESAEAASRAKSSFLANMSHEIRTPMNGIIGMSQLLAQTDLQPHQRDFLATVDESAHILLRLLNDILDFSKIEAGKLELECVDFRLSECISRASQMLVLRSAEKGLELACRVAPEIPDHLRGDPGRIRQVIVNLLGNAVKFTEAGEIFVNVDVESNGENKITLHFSVSDTGVGISPETQGKIFAAFEQAESSTTRRFGGTGLGLTISKQLIEMMGGRMWLESELGRGSTFHFTVPFEICANQHLREPAELSSLNGLTVLVVDDNFTNRRILSELLLFWNMKPILADSAAAGRAELEKAETTQSPIRLILLDHHMPGEDGLHFAESLHGLLNHQPCPIVMISSGSVSIDANLLAKQGICRFMTKPVIASELLNEVLHQFALHSPSTSSQPQSSEGHFHARPRRVLLVDDNEINRRVALGLLRTRGHQPEIAVNGLEAVNKLAEQEFDVVLMDMQMPVMDGYEATAAIRKRERQTGGRIPIVAMTAEALKGDRERCLAIGMDDYVSKPIAPAQLYRAVERFPAVCLAASTDTPHVVETIQEPIDQPSGYDKSGVGVQPQADEAELEYRRNDEVPVVDWTVASKRLPGGIEVLREFCELVRSQTPALLDELRRSIETGDSKLLTRSAHTIKGSVSYFGAQPLIDAALALENLGRTESFDGVTEMKESLEFEVTRFFAALEVGPPDSASKG